MGFKNKNCFKRSASILVLLFLFIVVLIGATFFVDQKFGPGEKASAAPWMDASWHYRSTVTIDHTKVGTGGVTNFPVLLTGANMPAGLWANANADGSDLRMTSSDGATEINFELTSFTPGSTTMELWFLASSLSSSTDTTFYLYWGNAGASAKPAAWGQGVWSTGGFQGVWHLPNGTTLTVNDSSANATATTNYGATVDAGKINGGSAVGASAYIQMATSAALNITGNISMEAWINSSDGTVYDHIIGGYYNAGAYNGYGFCLNTATNNGKLGFWPGSGSWRASNTSIKDGQWHHVALVTNGTNVTFYNNGSPDGSPASPNPSSYSGVRAIGNHSDGAGSTGFRGNLDEVRISSVARTDADIKTDYNNQSSPATFYAMGTAQDNTLNRISGTINDGLGNPISGVVVSDGTRSATTIADGTYSIVNVPDGTYTLTPTKAGYEFSPATLGATVAGGEELTGNNFTAIRYLAVSIATSTTTNPNSFSKDRTLFEATNGDMISIYSAGAELDYKISSDHGNTWGSATKIIDSSTTDDTGFSGWITADNKIHFTYSDNNTNSYIFYRQLTYDTGTHAITSLGTEYTVESAGTSQSFPTVTQKSDATIFVAYRYYDATDYTIRVKASTDAGATWSASTTLSAATNASSATYPAITLWNDNPAVIYNFANTELRWNYYTGSAWQAAGWANEIIASDIGSTLNQEFSISQTTSDNYMHLAWKDDSVGIKYRMNANAAAGWDGSSTAITTGASHASDKNPSIGIGLNDAIYLYYSEYVGANAYNIKYVEKVGSGSTFGSAVAVTSGSDNNLVAQAALKPTKYSSTTNPGVNPYSPVIYVSGIANPYSLNYAPTVKRWTAAANGNWETAGNWTPSGAPTAGDIVVFDSASTRNCTVTTYTSGNGIVDGLGGLNVETGYSGTLNFQKKPSQNASPYMINITGDFVINAGTVTSEGDTTAVHGGVTDGQGNTYNASNLIVATGASFNADGIGFSANNGPGKPAGSGIGASYGGEGYGSALSSVYGDYSNPVNLGSGSSSSYAVSGGGAIILNVTNTLIVSGTISANGSGSSYGGGGSGGSINLTAATISNSGGAGSITANGGSAQYGIGAGGGRVKLAGTTLSFNGTLTATGGRYTDCGPTCGVGSAGTVYKRTPTQSYGDLIIDNGTNTPNLTNQYGAHLKTSTDVGSYQFDSITCSNYGRLAIDSQTLALNSGSISGNANAGFINAGTVAVPNPWTISYFFSTKNGTVTNLPTTGIVISSTGFLTHFPNSNLETYTLNWSVASLNLQASGQINANYVGFATRQGTGKSTSSDVGASYGGEGSNGAALSTVYGDYSNPVNLGSGGTGGTGGGAIILNVTNTLTVSGTISANGAGGGMGSGGSGGSVNLAAATIAGATGIITTNGGGTSWNGTGGGGRIKLAATTLSYSGSIAAVGTTAGYNGTVSAAGTILKRTTAQTYGDLIIDNTGNTNTTTAYTPITAPLSLDNLTAQNYGKFQLNINATPASDILAVTTNINSTTHGEIKLMSDGGSTLAKGAGIAVTAANVTTDSTGLIDSNSSGFIHDSGYSNGKGLVAATRGGGGAFGGAGGASNDGGAGGQVYGSATDVAYNGSGGGAANLGGTGGGYISFNVSGTITNAGTISVNGAAGTTNGGGGSGGGLRIITNALYSTGTISANGGNGATNAGGGGGGRIFITCTGFRSVSPAATATGGTGANAGSDGTVTFQSVPLRPRPLSPLGSSSLVPGSNWIATDGSGYDWEYRQQIVIDHTKVGSGGVTNFPVLLTGASMDDGLWTQAKADGSDLRVTASDTTTEVNFELVSFTPGSTTMELWFLASSLSDSVDTTLYLYWGNDGASAKAAAWGQGVWGSDYKAAYHLGNGTTLSLTDSSAGGNGLTNAGAVSATAGAFGGGAIFNGTSTSALTKGSSATVPTGAITASLEMWFKMTSTGAQEIGGWGGNSNGLRFAAWYDSNVIYVDGCNYSRSFAWTRDSNWHHLVFTITSGNTNSEHAYLDGVEKTLSADSHTLGVTNSEIKLGGVPTFAGYYFGGSIDEFRIKAAVDSQPWVTSEFNNQNSPSTFIPAQAEISLSSGMAAALNISQNPAFTFSTTDPDGDYLRYKFQLATDSGFTLNLSEFVEGSDIPGQTQTSNGRTATFSGQDTQGGTAYASGTTATLTISSSTPLIEHQTYYWRVYAIDPAGSSTYSQVSYYRALTVSQINKAVFTTSPQTIVADEVSAKMTIEVRNDINEAVKLRYDQVFTLAASPTITGHFYSDAGGTTPITTVTVVIGAASADFYYKDDNPYLAAQTITASDNPPTQEGTADWTGCYPEHHHKCRGP